MKDQEKIKIHFFSANTKKAIIATRILKKKYKNYSIKNCDIIVAIGGDGTIISALHKSIKISKPIFGINRGEYGFLTNIHKNIDLIKRLKKAKKTEMHVLKMKVTTTKGKIYIANAVNEVSILRNSRHAAKIKILVDNVLRIKELVCDGILLSTPAGSTAYNLSAKGPIIPIKSKLLALTPISPFRPKGWRGALINSNSKVTFPWAICLLLIDLTTELASLSPTLTLHQGIKVSLSFIYQFNTFLGIKCRIIISAYVQ